MTRPADDDAVVGVVVAVDLVVGTSLLVATEAASATAWEDASLDPKKVWQNDEPVHKAQQ